MSGLFGGNSQPTYVQAPATPAVTPPTVQPVAPMPDSESKSVLEANRRAQQAVVSRAGRTSTILTTPQTRPATTNYDSYSNRNLG